MGGDRRRIASIQVLRAAAALSVFGLHLWQELAQWSGAPAPKTLVLAAGVDLFFVISGFIMVYVSEGLFAQPGAARQFFANRLVRIVPLYWIISVPLVFHALLRYADLASVDLSPGVLVGSLLFLPYPRPSGDFVPILRVGWTLNYEMFFYALFAGALVLPRWRAIGCVAGAISVAVIIGAFFNTWPEALALEFVFGMGVAVMRREIGQIPRWVCVSALIAGVVGLAIGSSVDPNSAARALCWGIPCTCLVAGATLHRFDLKGPLWALPLLLGDASYALYLFHPFASAPRLIAQRLLGTTDGPWAWWPVSYAAFLIVSAILVAIGVHLAIERPVIRMLRRKPDISPPLRTRALG